MLIENPGINDEHNIIKIMNSSNEDHNCLFRTTLFNMNLLKKDEMFIPNPPFVLNRSFLQVDETLQKFADSYGVHIKEHGFYDKGFFNSRLLHRIGESKENYVYQFQLHNSEAGFGHSISVFTRNEKLHIFDPNIGVLRVPHGLEFYEEILNEHYPYSQNNIAHLAILTSL